MKNLESKVSNFVAAAITGALFEGITGPNSNAHNLGVAVLLGGPGEFVAERYLSRIPVVNAVFRGHNETDEEVIKSRVPVAIAGYMVGQTLTKYLK